jgi:hypothetical protein
MHYRTLPIVGVDHSEAVGRSYCGRQALFEGKRWILDAHP